VVLRAVLEANAYVTNEAKELGGDLISPCCASVSGPTNAGKQLAAILNYGVVKTMEPNVALREAAERV
jgi:hypothetical protein